MTAKDRVRLLVIKTNRMWPFSFLNKIPYNLTIKALILAFGRLPEIESIYLRHGLTKSDWIPAISDIDLTVIFDGTLDSNGEYQFLQSFWKKFIRLKKLFPMLGEIDILSDEQIVSWTRFTIRGHEAETWKLIYGTPTVQNNYVADPQRILIDTLNDSLTTYLEYFLEKFHDRERPYELVLNELARLTYKMLNRLNTSGKFVMGRTGSPGCFTDMTEMLMRVMRQLEEKAKDLNITIEDQNLGDDRGWLESENLGDPGIQNERPEHLDSCDDVVESVILSKENDFIVLREPIEDSQLADCIEKIRSQLIKTRRLPIIVGSNAFKYMITSYNPFMYIGLALGRSVPFGSDPLADMRMPYRYYFAKALLEQTINVLTFPRRLASIVPVDSNWFREKAAQDMLERSIHLKLFLERGILKSKYKRYLSEYEEHYPHYYRIICELSQYSDVLKINSLNKRWFALFRSLAEDIHRAISESSFLENFFVAESTWISEGTQNTGNSRINPMKVDVVEKSPNDSMDKHTV